MELYYKIIIIDILMYCKKWSLFMKDELSEVFAKLYIYLQKV